MGRGGGEGRVPSLMTAAGRCRWAILCMTVSGKILCGYLIQERVLAVRLWAAILVSACGREAAVAIAENLGCERCGNHRR
jgi:hypothetical protein